MKYLIDTCIISYFVKGDVNVLKAFKATDPSLMAISSITAMEIEYGIQLHPERTTKLAPLIAAVLETLQILAYSIADAHASATLRAYLQRQGKLIGAYDILIAGCALARGLTLVTSNTSEFNRVSGLKCEDWRKSY